MADHLITGTMTYVVIHCGNLRCRHVWEQPHTDLNDPGTNVCPECLWAAPTNVGCRCQQETARLENCSRPAVWEVTQPEGRFLLCTQHVQEWRGLFPETTVRRLEPLAIRDKEQNRG